MRCNSCLLSPLRTDEYERGRVQTKIQFHIIPSQWLLFRCYGQTSLSEWGHPQSEATVFDPAQRVWGSQSYLSMNGDGLPHTLPCLRPARRQEGKV